VGRTDLAEGEAMDALVVGHELVMAALDPAREESWRRVIASVREHCSGPLLWSAHWESEFEDLPFWDALDLMGVSVYFPVSQSADPTDEELRAVWRSAAERIGQASARHGRAVVFTEIGYRSAADAAIAPWLWRSDAALDLDLQVRLCEAMFDACWDEPWFAGLFIWKWHPRPGAGGDLDASFTPQGKPSLRLIQDRFER
jgi:glycosyl hydrolase family 113